MKACDLSKRCSDLRFLVLSRPTNDFRNDLALLCDIVSDLAATSTEPHVSVQTNLPAGDEADAAAADDAAVLRRRLIDMAHGANAGYSIAHIDGSDADEYTMCESMGIEAFAAWVRCIERQLAPEDLVVAEIDNLHHFDTLDGAVRWLLKHGVRG